MCVIVCDDGALAGGSSQLCVVIGFGCVINLPHMSSHIIILCLSSIIFQSQANLYILFVTGIEWTRASRKCLAERASEEAIDCLSERVADAVD
jgi:hypothetical protein